MAPTLENTTYPSWSDNVLQRKWTVYLEMGILGIMVLIGGSGNIKVMLTFFKIKSLFARQIMVLFFTLAISDGLICSVRIPLMMYRLVRPSWDKGNKICAVWILTYAILGIIIIKNLLVALQRLVIMTSFPFYRRHFTLKRVIIIIILIWALQFGGFLFFSFVGEIRFLYDIDGICIVASVTSGKESTVWYIVEGLLGIILISLTSFCHIWIVHKIISAGLTKLDRIDERSSYIRINVTAILRTLLMLICWVPYLVINMLGTETHLFHAHAFVYLDYLLCLQSVISPFITLQDSDFSDSFSRKKTYVRRCVNSTNPHTTLRRSIRRCLSNITSGDMHTNRQTE